MDFKCKIELLKQYETECYQICVYLLGDNCKASRAAEELLIELYASDVFWHDPAGRGAFIRKLARKRAFMAIKAG